MKKKPLPKNKKPAQASVDVTNIDILYQKASAYIDQARQTIYRTIDTEMVKAYWCIGRDIADLGQMQLYVNYFDEEVAARNDNPTIGLIL